MTDNEIIKALECCSEANNCIHCEYEPTKYKKGTIGCSNELVENAIDLIKRQQAEIERLKTEKDNLIKTYAECQIENIKNFVEKLKVEIQCSIDVGGHYVLYEVVKDIDNLVKEWGGADNG